MTVVLHHGDCRDVLATLPAESVQCVVTSPPYFGLRDYGTARWEGGDPACDHGAARLERRQSERQPSLGGGVPGSLRDKPVTACKCGAIRVDGQIGLEQSPQEYVAQLVAVFREVRRVLRKDATCWLNLGDSYNAAGRIGHGTRIGYKQGTNRASGSGQDHTRATDDTLKPKDLLLIPARVALALQEDGWWVRSEIIWSKAAPMPESVRDRPTCAHEKVWLLTKSARYFYDADAVAEPAVSDHDSGNGYGRPEQLSKGGRGQKSGWTRDANPTRNLRNVWHLNPEPFSGSHFATMPCTLAERCIKAGSRPGDTVLDPFAGAGTTLLVADRLQRHSIGIELNADYIAIAQERLRGDAPLFAEVA